MYCTPKIHKQGNPLRPIVDYTGSIGCETSWMLMDILSPLVGNSEYYVKNSRNLVEEIQHIKVEDDEIMISHDVISLFTNAQIPDTLNIIGSRLESDTSLKDRTKLEVKDIMQLLQFIVTTTYFPFQGQLYQQTFGTAMGSSVSPVIVNLYMEWLEEEAMKSVPQNIQPKIWKR